MMRYLASLLIVLMLAVPGWAVQPGEQLPDPRQEARARAISSELRCLVCQNQSIDDSDASLARDLRVLVRERIRAGDNDAAIRAYLVGRYGEFILLRPAFGWQTALLWLTPAMALLLGGLAARSAFRRRVGGSAADDEPAPLSDSEARAVQAIIERQKAQTGPRN